jgi:PAS domain S-box-containing protein
MTDTGAPGKNGAQIAGLAELRAQLREAQETIDAIRGGGVDSLMIGSPGQEQVYAVASADRTYRLIVNAMDEGTATVSLGGVVLDANPRLCRMTGHGTAELIGTAMLELIAAPHRSASARMLEVGVGETARGEVELRGPGGTTVPVLLAVSGFDLDGMVLQSLVLTDLTAQRAAEAAAARAHAAMRDQNAFLEQAQDAVGLGWWNYDPKREVMLTFSAGACRVFGVAPAEFDGKMATLLDLVHPEDVARITEAATAALAGGVPYQVEHRLVRPDGSIRWVLQAAVVQRDDDGAPRRMLGICQDITDRKRIEDEIRAAADYHRSLIEANLNPMVTISLDGAISDVNLATEQVTGCERAELLGTEFSSYFTDPDLAKASYEHVFRDGQALDYPLELRHRDGHVTSVLYNAALYRDPSGRVLGVIAAARDVTQTNRMQAALSESEKRLRAVFEYAQVGIGEVGIGGQAVRVNPYFCQLVGYTSDELLSMNLMDLIHPDDCDIDSADQQRIISGEIDTYTTEKRYLRKNGSLVWAEVSSAMVRDADGKPTLSVATMRDLTAERRAEAEIQALNADLEARVEARTAELERANKNLEAFSYSVSHDLRAPLRALQGFSEALLEEYSDTLGETGQGYARRIGAASERMAALIDDLLLLSRVSRAGMNLIPVNLSAEVASILDELQLQGREPDRQVRFSVQEDVWVTADRALIRSVLQNLLENAWKFTSRRSDAVIEFGTTPIDDDTRICCFVRDNGAGFDPAYTDKLFKPFQRLHTDRDFPGNGIGLASVQRVIERHGGLAWAEGVIDKGATFSFTLTAATPTPR